jgi:hypothetical protein
MMIFHEPSVRNRPRPTFGSVSPGRQQ